MEDDHAAEVFLGTDEEDVSQDSIQAMSNALGQGQPSPQTGGSAGSGGRNTADATASQEQPGTASTVRGQQQPSTALCCNSDARRRIRRKSSPAPCTGRV